MRAFMDAITVLAKSSITQRERSWQGYNNNNNNNLYSCPENITDYMVKDEV